ncbi:MAG: hypothetical protein Q7W02_19480 [Candidatus Rokubacteria bacterium]|nr:hypothetical protein [Candidatus Rokubacteria bacterium]
MARALALSASVAGILLAALPVAPAPSTAVRAVAAIGDSAPGGGKFGGFTVESLPVFAPTNNRGQVAFFATIHRGPGGEGFFLRSRDRVTKIAREGDAVPGVGALSGFGRHPIPALNESGAVAFAAAVAGGKTVEGIFLSARGRIQPVALSGGPAPGVSSGTLAGVESPALNDRGDVAFLATVRRGRESLEAIYVREAGGKLRKVVVQGDPAPAGGSFAGFGAPVLNNKGVVGFAAAVEGKAVPGGIFLAAGDQVRMLVGAGDDTPVGGIFFKFSERFSLNDAGTVAFNAVLKDAPAAGGQFVIQAGRVLKVAVVGDAAPGGGAFSHFGLWPSLNARGSLAFVASVDGGPSPMAVFVGDPVLLERITGIGDDLPGGRLQSFGLYPLVAINNAGGVTFAAAPTATGEGVEGIFLTGPDARP